MMATEPVQARTAGIPTWVPKLFVFLAGAIVLAFGVLSMLDVLASNSPLARVQERLVQSGRFHVMDLDWDPTWTFDTVEDAPWIKDVGGTVPASTVNFHDGTYVVNVWASWCPPCRSEMPAMLQLARTLEKEKITFVFISYDEGWPEVAQMYRDVAGGMPRGVVNVRDVKGAGAGTDKPTDTFWVRLGATAVPETFVIRDGKVLAKVVGEIDWKHRDIREYLTLIAKK